MKRVMIAAAAVMMAAGLAACETATPYQPAQHGPGSNGFSEYRIDSTHWKVTFAGNSLTSRETVEKYLLYRAAELTVQQGFDWFETVDRHTERNTRYQADVDPFYAGGFGAAYGWGWRPDWRYFGPSGWGFWDPWGRDPFWADTMDIRQINRYEASAEIAMGKGAAPEGRKVLVAHEVVENLGPSIQRPKS